MGGGSVWDRMLEFLSLLVHLSLSNNVDSLNKKEKWPRNARDGVKTSILVGGKNLMYGNEHLEERIQKLYWT